MNRNIQLLDTIARKKVRTIIGLMSGTSLDGLDVAVCNIEGSGKNTKLDLRQFVTVPYEEDFKEEVKTVFSKEEVNLQKLCLLNEWIGKQHASMIKKFLNDWKIVVEEVDIIASHGQTVYHAPLSLHGLEKYGNGTLQIGDGDHIAVNTGILTISDFRQKHLAAGGEGAPLAAYGDYLLFMEEDTDVILLNIGGIANFTFLPANIKDGRMFSSDTGPGNTMMDAWMQENFPGKSYDRDAAIAKNGRVSERLLKSLMDNDFLQAPLPKTTGPELFNLTYLKNALKHTGVEKLSVADVMATLNRFSAKTIADAILPLVSKKPCKIYSSGGGMHNPLLMDYLKHEIKGATIDSTDKKNINPDAKEAILFAILANECIAGNASDFVSGINNFPPVSMGKISFPY
jgi:anhydro-N-acetylmuramic acid kinase